MPRLARLVIPGVALHVTQRGHDRRACFREDTDRMVYLTLLREGLKLMRNLGQRYVQYFNRRYERSGTLWEGRPHSCLVDSAPYVLACYRYIELNPVRAGMIPATTVYEWSSHEANAGRVADPELSPHAEYVALSDDSRARCAAYEQLFQKGDDAQFLSEIRDATNGGYPLVGEKLKAALALPQQRLERSKPGPTSRKEQAKADGSTGELPF